jgi:hypothetical protein
VHRDHDKQRGEQATRRTSRLPCPGPVVSPGAVPCSMSHAALLSRRHPLQIPPPQFRGSCQCVGSLVSYKVLSIPHVHVSRMYPACIPSYQIHLSPDAFEIHVSHYVSHYVSRMYPVCILITSEDTCILRVSRYHGACACSVRQIIPYTEVPVSLVRFSQ